MKYVNKIFITLLVLPLLIITLSVYATPEVNENEEPSIKYFTPTGLYDERNEEGKYLILNDDGTYGGSYHELKYGTGAPFSGEYDQTDSEYYMINDYYHMDSDIYRSLFPKFSSYQQTMQDTSGIACVMMILNYLKVDISSYSEYELMLLYEKLNGTKIYGNGTNAQGIAKLINALDLGYDVDPSDYKNPGTTRAVNEPAFASWMKSQVDEGKFVMMRYNSKDGFGWQVVIGYDTMGTDENCHDDVIIFANPLDGSDHYQDGYTVNRAINTYHWWEQIDITAQLSNKLNCVVIDPHIDINFNRQERDMTIEQIIPEVHLILNADGSYGGTTDEELYGKGTPLNGANNHIEENYYKYNDYYNMTSSDTRVLLTNYKAFQQTMSSTCGISATISVLNYYGEDVSVYNEIWFVETYEKMHSVSIKGSGTGTGKLRDVIETIGYTGYSSTTSAGKVGRFEEYWMFLEWARYNIINGRPMVICVAPRVGHYITIIGIDDMGTDYIYDDVIIIADSGDSWDHYQDGYNTYSAYHLYKQHYNGGLTLIHPSLLIFGKKEER